MKQKAKGGGDHCEDLIGALKEALKLCKELKNGYLCLI